MILRLGVAALLLLPSAAFAQGDPGPFGGLFGRTPERSGREFTAFDFRSALSGQYEEAILVDESIPAGDVRPSGYGSGVNTGLVFMRQSDRVWLRAHGGATYQEYYRKPVFGATSYDAALQFRVEPATKFHLHGQAVYNRSPYFRLLPGLTAFQPAVITPNDPFAVHLIENQSYDVGGGFLSRYAKHSSLEVTARQRETRFDGTENNALRVVGMEAIWRRQLSRSFAVHAGYGQERGRYSAQPDAPFTYELLDIGVDFTRQLSVARRTTLEFATETAMIKRPVTGRRYRLNGHANLTTYFRRTWRATMGFRRNTEFRPGFFEPLLTDAVTGMVDGLLAPRVEWITAISAGKGRWGFDDGRPYTLGQTVTRVNWAITRRLGVFAEHSVYYHNLPQTPAGFALTPELSRQAFAIGFNTWIPIVNKVRAPRDPE